MDSNRTSQRGNFLLILIAMILGVLIGLMTARSIARRDAGTLESKVDEVAKLIEHEYVDSIEPDSLSERLLRVMLSELDPHSSYFSTRETERNAEMMRGNFEGVGILLHREGDTTYVGQLTPNGPSAKSGLLPGDKILTVDGEAVSGVGMPADSVVSRLRGPRRTSATVVVERLTAHAATCHPDTLTFVLHRGVVEHQTIVCATMIDDTTGYIQLTSFASTSHSEFRQALLKLKDAGMRRLLFDLRGNTGGSLSSAVGIAGELLPAGSPIVYTQGAHSRRHDVNARRGGLFTQGTVVVLVDENSASASEVVAGALQDNDRAIICGRRTFGKGLVQSSFDMHDGSSILLTTARYYTPSGRCIQRSYSHGTNEYYREYIEQLIGEAYADTLQAHIADSTPYHTRSGRTVYGGGGIVPDKLLAYHKDSSFVYYNALADKGVIDKVAFAWVRRHAGQWLLQYPTPQAFIRNFTVPQPMIDEVPQRGEREGVTINQRSLAAQQRLIATQLKAHIAFALFDSEAYRMAYLPMDEDIKRVKHIQP